MTKFEMIVDFKSKQEQAAVKKKKVVLVALAALGVSLLLLFMWFYLCRCIGWSSEISAEVFLILTLWGIASGILVVFCGLLLFELLSDHWVLLLLLEDTLDIKFGLTKDSVSLHQKLYNDRWLVCDKYKVTVHRVYHAKKHKELRYYEICAGDYHFSVRPKDLSKIVIFDLNEEGRRRLYD